MDQTVVRGRSRFSTGADSDQLLVMNSSFQDRVSASLGSGNDLAFVYDADGLNRFSGGGGTDRANPDAPEGRSIEQTDVTVVGASYGINADLGELGLSLQIT